MLHAPKRIYGRIYVVSAYSGVSGPMVHWICAWTPPAIEVNDEFGVLDTMLRNLPACLKPGGRVAILSFHSAEDRRVKKCFQTGERNGTFSSAAADPIRASYDEQRSNPRSSSAKLRWAVRALH